MKDRVSLRSLMIAAGLLAAVTLVVSPVFLRETARVMTECRADGETPDKESSVSAASTEAITSSQAVQVEHVTPFTIQEIILEQKLPSAVLVAVTLPATAPTRLLRFVIAPQAP